MWNARKQRGLSLLEVLIVCALMGVLGSLFVALILPTVRVTAQQPARAEIQQQAIPAVNNLANAVESTTAAGISYRPTTPVALGVVPLAEVDVQGRQVWSTNLTVFYWETSGDRLAVKVWPASLTSPSLALNPARPYQASPLELAQVCSSLLATPRNLAVGVSSFSVNGTTQGLAMPLNITLVLTRKIPQQEEPERFTASKVVTARQSR